MARKLRIQYEGAIYHVINRGNYRRDVFETVGAAQAFEEALMEGCEVSGWKLHAHVVMRNHYHLALETPRANLVEGMHWLQSTFSTRFNRLRRERGHLFQGRYQALLVEDMASLSRVVDYIHLYPARAKIIEAGQLKDFRWSSLRRFLRGPRPGCMVAADWLKAHGLADTEVGLRAYSDHLSALAGDELEQKKRGLENMSKGWAIGSSGWRRSIAKDHAQLALAPDMEASELRSLKETFWTGVLDEGLARHNQTRESVVMSGGNIPWKLEMLTRLREAGAPFPWIAQRLHIGTACTARVYYGLVKSNL